MKGLVFQVQRISTTTDRRVKTVRDGKMVNEVTVIEELTLSTPYEDPDFMECQVGNVCGAYLPMNVGSGGTTSEIVIQILDPKLQGQFKVGDRIDLLRAKL